MLLLCKCYIYFVVNLNYLGREDKTMKKTKWIKSRLLAILLSTTMLVLSGAEVFAAGADITGDQFGKDGSIYAVDPSGVVDASKIIGVTVTVKCVKFFEHMGDNSCCVALYDDNKIIMATGTGKILDHVSAMLGKAPIVGSGDTFTLTYDADDLSKTAVVACSGDFKIVNVEYKYAANSENSGNDGASDGASGGASAGASGNESGAANSGASDGAANAPKTGDTATEAFVYGTVALFAAAAVAAMCVYRKKIRV